MSTREVIDRDAVAAFARQHATAVVDLTGNQEIGLDDAGVVWVVLEGEGLVFATDAPGTSPSRPRNLVTRLTTGSVAAAVDGSSVGRRWILSASPGASSPWSRSAPSTAGRRRRAAARGRSSASGSTPPAPTAVRWSTGRAGRPVDGGTAAELAGRLDGTRIALAEAEVRALDEQLDGGGRAGRCLGPRRGTRERAGPRPPRQRARAARDAAGRSGGPRRAARRVPGGRPIDRGHRPRRASRRSAPGFAGRGHRPRRRRSALDRCGSPMRGGRSRAIRSSGTAPMAGRSRCWLGDGATTSSTPPAASGSASTQRSPEISVTTASSSCDPFPRARSRSAPWSASPVAAPAATSCGSVLAALVIGLIALVPPLATSLVFGQIVPQHQTERLAALAAALVGLAIGSFFLQLARGVALLRARTTMDHASAARTLGPVAAPPRAVLPALPGGRSHRTVDGGRQHPRVRDRQRHHHVARRDLRPLQPGGHDRDRRAAGSCRPAGHRRRRRRALRDLAGLPGPLERRAARPPGDDGDGARAAERHREGAHRERRAPNLRAVGRAVRGRHADARTRRSASTTFASSSRERSRRRWC